MKKYLLIITLQTVCIANSCYEQESTYNIDRVEVAFLKLYQAYLGSKTDYIQNIVVRQPGTDLAFDSIKTTEWNFNEKCNFALMVLMAMNLENASLNSLRYSLGSDSSKVGKLLLQIKEQDLIKFFGMSKEKASRFHSSAQWLTVPVVK